MESRIMTQQDKDLLLRDLCARLPHKAIIHIDGHGNRILNYVDTEDEFINCAPLKAVKPYLRPLSNLTQEERDKFCDIGGVISYRPTDGKQYIVAFVPEALDYLNSIHADYRGLIEKGLAIEVTDENNPYK